MRQAFIDACRAQVGTPWVHQGRTPGLALDCLGLIIASLWQIGLKPRTFDIVGYGEHPDGSMLALCRQHMREIPRTAARSGSVVLLAGDEGPRHLGVLWDYAPGHLGIVHARAGGKREARVVEHRLLLGPRMRLVAAFDIPGLN